MDNWSEEMFNRLRNRDRVETSVEYNMEKEKVLLLQVAHDLQDLSQSTKYCYDLHKNKKKSIDSIRCMVEPLKTGRRQILLPLEVIMFT